MAFGTDGAVKGIQYTYDGLGRVTQIARGNATVDKNGKKVTVNGTANLQIAYGYVAGDTSRFGSWATTPLIGKIVHGSNGLTFAYTYDATGNILTVKQYTPQAKTKTPLTAGANAMAKPDKATPTCESQSSFLPRQEAAQGQVYPEQQQDEKVQAQQFEPQLLQKTQVLSEKDSSAAIEPLMKKAMMIRQAVDSRKEITDRV